jgi:hypothetical protein
MMNEIIMAIFACLARFVDGLTAPSHQSTTSHRRGKLGQGEPRKRRR